MECRTVFVGAADRFAIHRLAAQEFTVDGCDTARHRIIVVQRLVVDGDLRFQLSAVHLA